MRKTNNARLYTVVNILILVHKYKFVPEDLGSVLELSTAQFYSVRLNPRRRKIPAFLVGTSILNDKS
jgi:hypothetical protein